jgi:glycerate dehydrogenase
MRIVVLDGYTMNPGDNSWEPVSRLGAFSVYDRTPIERIVERAGEAEVILVNKTPLSADTLRQLPKLRHIAVLATGYDIVDIQAAGRQGISVSNAPAYGVDAVAQQAMALLLELCRGAGLHSASVKKGEWAKSPDWCYWLKPQRELFGLVLGLVGFGNNGRRLGELGHAFGMDVISYTVPATDPPAYEPFRFVEADELFRTADVISLHCPLTEETRNLINETSIAAMKRGCIVINTARGPLVDEAAVARALYSGQLGGFGADVLSVEPPTPDNPLLQTPNTLITPHISWATLRARKNIMEIIAGNIEAFLAGNSRNVVNTPFLHKKETV